MKIARWGDSLAVRLPIEIVEALDLKEGEEIELRLADPKQFEIARKPSVEEVLRRIRAIRPRLPADYKFDRDEANAPVASSTATPCSTCCPTTTRRPGCRTK